MNNARRKSLNLIIQKLMSISSDIQDILAEEEEYRDNIPENLQGGDRYCKADESCDAMQDAIDLIGDAMDALDNAM